MDGRELNKIAAALLFVAISIGVVDWAGAALVPVDRPAHAAFVIAEASAGTSASSAPTSIDIRLTTASASRGGEAAGSLCGSCHSFDKDGPTIVGPNLYGVAGRAVASSPGYGYSAALRQVGGRWTLKRLDAWLTRPQGFAAGTRMGFAGIADENARADMVAYLVTLADPPVAGSRPAPDLAALVAKADPRVGATIATASCSACHSFEQGGGAMVGPALYGVFGRGIAQGSDYSYSAALSSHRGAWTTATLDRWLTSPRRFAPGTKMAYPGLPDDAERAALIAYLKTLSDKT